MVRPSFTLHSLVDIQKTVCSMCLDIPNVGLVKLGNDYGLEAQLIEVQRLSKLADSIVGTDILGIPYASVFKDALNTLESNIVTNINNIEYVTKALDAGTMGFKKWS